MRQKDVIGKHCSCVNGQDPDTTRHLKGRNGTLGSGGLLDLGKPKKSNREHD